MVKSNPKFSHTWKQENLKAPKFRCTITTLRRQEHRANQTAHEAMKLCIESGWERKQASQSESQLQASFTKSIPCTASFHSSLPFLTNSENHRQIFALLTDSMRSQLSAP
uniref:Uncharacterized protein n=1 Tax=Physcomitrium patens TaxID=3218 RepID=A0A2K1J884_PHYPA|nr:hypothetical protein PHYPA_020854 [Physcomitrium patens]